MALTDIIGDSVNSGELSFSRGNTGLVEEIITKGNNVAEIPKAISPSPILAIGL